MSDLNSLADDSATSNTIPNAAILGTNPASLTGAVVVGPANSTSVYMPGSATIGSNAYLSTVNYNSSYPDVNMYAPPQSTNGPITTTTIPHTTDTSLGAVNSTLGNTFDQSITSQAQSPSQSQSQTPTTTTATTEPKKHRKRKSKRPEHKSKLITGYIIYASEIRKEIIKQYPDNDFGYISKIVGNEWKALPQETKVAYEKRAKEQNIKSKALCAEAKARHLVEQQNASLNNANSSFVNDSISSSFGDGSNTGDNSQLSLSTSASNQNYSANMNSKHLSNSFGIGNQSGLATSPGSRKANTPARRTIQATSRPLNATVNRQNNVNVIKRNAYVKLKPKDAIVQTEPILWIKPPARKQIRFSEKFIDYLKNCASYKPHASQLDIGQL